MNRTKATEQLIELKLKEFEVRYMERMKDLNETLQSIVRQQEITENIVSAHFDDSVRIIEDTSKEMNNEIVKAAEESIQECEDEVNIRNNNVEMFFSEVYKQMEKVQESSLKEYEKINSVGDMNGIQRMKIEQMLERTDRCADEKFDEIQKNIEKLKASLETAQEKMYDHECNKKNNLIFYGIPQEQNEDLSMLHAKVLALIRVNLNIKRNITIISVSRMYTGPEVHGCRPILVTFEDFNEKEEVLKTSKLLKDCGLTVTQDIPKKIREARQELKKYLRIVKRHSPDKYCFLQYDKLFIEGKVFMFDEGAGRVVEQKLTNEGLERYFEIIQF